MFPAWNGFCIPLQRCVNYQCWAIPTYILDILVRENTLWAGVIPSPLTKEHLTLQMRNPSDVSRIFFFLFFLKYCPARNHTKPASWQLGKSFAGPYPQLEEPAALALNSVEFCYIKTGVNIHIVFFFTTSLMFKCWKNQRSWLLNVSICGYKTGISECILIPFNWLANLQAILKGSRRFFNLAYWWKMEVLWNMNLPLCVMCILL